MANDKQREEEGGFEHDQSSDADKTNSGAGCTSQANAREAVSDSCPALSRKFRPDSFAYLHACVGASGAVCVCASALCCVGVALVVVVLALCSTDRGALLRRFEGRNSGRCVWQWATESKLLSNENAAKGDTDNNTQHNTSNNHQHGRAQVSTRQRKQQRASEGRGRGIQLRRHAPTGWQLTHWNLWDLKQSPTQAASAN